MFLDMRIVAFLEFFELRLGKGFSCCVVCGHALEGGGFKDGKRGREERREKREGGRGGGGRGGGERRGKREEGFQR